MIPHICRPWFRLLLATLAMTTASVQAPAAPTPAPTPRPARIVAVGDLHGDHDAWRAIARAAGLIDAAGRWAGGKTVFVQTGDIVDRAPDSLRIIRDFQRLEREAARAGGRVVVLVGNHEAMMVTADLRYVHPGEYAAFVDKRSARRREAVYAANRDIIETAGRALDATLSAAAIREGWLASTPLGKLEHQAAWHPGGELGRWIVAKPAVVRISGSLFVHGGLSPAFAALTLDEINRRVAAALAARETEQSSIINDPAGPLWYRGLAGMAVEQAAPTVNAPAPPVPPPPNVDQLLDQVLAATGARRIVIGHTPLVSGVAVTHGGRLVRIDSGNSRAYGGVPGFVEILGDRVVTHNVARSAATPGGEVR